MNNEFVGQVIAFRGNDEYLSQANTLIEVTEIEGQKVEIAFNLTGKKERVYLSFELPELLAHAMEASK